MDWCNSVSELLSFDQFKLSARLQYLHCLRSGDYKNQLHLDVVNRYLRRMGDKTIPDEAPSSLDSFIPHESQESNNHNQGVVDSLSRSPKNTNKDAFWS